MHAAMEGVVDCVGAVGGHYQDTSVVFEYSVEFSIIEPQEK